MPKLGMEPIRRRSLIEATIAAIHHRGSVDVTMRDIAERAGVSLGLAHHYFSGKNELLISAMRAIMREYGLQVRAALGNAPGPRARVAAIIEASLGAEQFRPEIVSAWLVFYTHALGSRPARQLLSIYTRRLHSNLRHALRPLVGPAADRVALGISALIDGIYIREGLGIDRPTRQDAVALVEDYVATQLAAARRPTLDVQP